MKNLTLPRFLSVSLLMVAWLPSVLFAGMEEGTFEAFPFSSSTKRTVNTQPSLATEDEPPLPPPSEGKGAQSFVVWAELPPELKLEVLSFLDSTDLVSVMTVSKECGELARHPSLWRKMECRVLDPDPSLKSPTLIYPGSKACKKRGGPWKIPLHYKNLSLVGTELQGVALFLPPGLRRLDIKFTNFTAEELLPLTRLTALRELNIWHNLMLGDAAIPYINLITTLRHLNITQTSVTEEGIQGLALPHLEELTVAPAGQVRLRVVPSLEPSPALRTLNLGWNDLTVEGLLPLARLKDLTGLNLTDNRNLGDAAIPSINGITTLRRLIIRGIGVTAQGMGLLDLPNLTYLDLSDNNLGDAALLSLGTSPAITHLYINKTGITSEGIRLLATILPNLREIDASENDLKDDSLPYFNAFAGLTKLNLERTNLTTLRGLRLAKLRTLNVNHNKNTDEGISTLIEDLPALEILDIIFNKLTMQGLRTLIDSNIKGLFTGSNQTTPEEDKLLNPTLTPKRIYWERYGRN